MNSLKSVIRIIAEPLVASDTTWKVLSKTLIRSSQYLCSLRNQHEVERAITNHAPASQALRSRKVIAGPFRGMNYGTTKAMCSALYPKLLGTYEHELAAVFAEALTCKYSLVVDIGAADGYYAVGFAYANTNTRVIAYDQDPRAREELAKLARLNDVQERIEIREQCNPSDLVDLPVAPGLVIVDCEGFEDQLLTQQNINHLQDWDFIIETHDGLVPNITKRLIERFSRSHRVEVIDSIHDYDKADHVEAPILDGMSRRAIDRVLAEGREHACLRWIYCTPLGKS